METSFAVRLGLKAAIDVALQRDRRSDLRRIGDLVAHARAALAPLPEVTVEDWGDALSGIVTFVHARLEPIRIRAELAARRINVAAPSEAYAPWWVRAGRPYTTRISPHAFNTHEEIDATVAAIAAL